MLRLAGVAGRITLGQVITYHGIVTAALAAGELETQSAVIHFIHLDRHDAFQLLDAALHLYSLGGLIAEALDEGLDVSYLLLLILIGTQLLLPALGPQVDILVVLDLVVIHPSAGYLQRAVGYIIYKCTVVAHQHHCSGAGAEELLEPLNALDVEMIGGLIEQEHVRTAQQKLCQLDAHAPSAAELAGGPVKVTTAEAQSLQGAFQLGLVIEASHHLEAVAQMREAFHQRHVFFRLVIGALGQLVVHLLYLALHIADARKSLLGLLTHRVSVTQHHHLWQVSHCGITRHRHCTLGGSLQPRYHLEHRALAGTVLAHQGNAVAVVDDITDIGEERPCAELHTQMVY